MDEEEQPSRWSRFRDFVLEHRRRFATGALLVFLTAVALEVGGAYPRSVEIAVPLGASHLEVTEAVIEVSQQGESVISVTLSFREPPPLEVRDTVELSPGDYDVHVRLTDREGHVRALRGQVTAPAEGVVRLALEGA